MVLIVIAGHARQHALSSAAEDASSPPPVFFEDNVASLLRRHCTDCHNADDREAMLDLSTVDGIQQGSESGVVVSPFNPARSLLYEVLRSGEMPPDGERLSTAEIELVGEWIKQGTRYRHPSQVAEQRIDQHHVLPILLLRCTACHGADLKRGKLDLRTVASLQRGSSNGPIAIAGNPDASLMIQRIETQACPPQGDLLKYFVARPSEAEVATLRRWITDAMPVSMPDPQGPIDPNTDAPLQNTRTLGDDVPDDERHQSKDPHWAFQPLPQRVMPPTFQENQHELRHQGIDAFIYQRLQQEGLKFSPPATRYQLIRRAHMGLIGIPPTVDELRHWNEDSRPHWYEAMVEELLASPHYGERWGRLWLDVAGYADSEGGQSEDPVREFAWKYRDYVIRSLNADKPWNRFLHEQVAGDELADFHDPEAITDEIIDNLIATGFLRMGVDETGSRTMNFVPERIGLIAEAIDVVGTGVLGLTIECARCHSHKYDPISHSDYYRFKAIFQGAFDEHDWLSWRTRNLEVDSPRLIAERQSNNPPLERQIKGLQKQRQSLIDQYQSEPRVVEQELVRQYRELSGELDRIDIRIETLRRNLIPPATIRALWDRGRPSPTYILIRGEHDRPGRFVSPGVPSTLAQSMGDLKVEPPWPEAQSTGRRLAFAKWLTQPNHPLTSRVMVNRVWSIHMGRGIVESLDNFGIQGAKPTHPELLDYLAREFVSDGWSLKALHRKILVSQTYRQSSFTTAHAQILDPDNQFWSRMMVRRLDAESLRDSLLSVAGRLDHSMFGPPAAVTVRDDGLVMQKQNQDSGLRRSIYVQMRRTEMPSLLSLFDYPEMRPNCVQRSTSTVSLQSLLLQNNLRVHQWAGDLAVSILAETDSQHTEVAQLAYETTFCRPPTVDELTEANEMIARFRTGWRNAGSPEADIERLALTTFCHTLINSAEFSYID